jgi:primosomal protein N'
MAFKFFYNITPLINLPVKVKQSFTYGSNLNLTKGDLVKINFKNKIIEGLIEEKLSKNQVLKLKFIKIKPIINLILKNFLPAWQLDLTKQYANYYLISYSLFLKITCPRIVRLSYKKKSVKSKNYSSKFNINKAELKTGKKILSLIKNQKNSEILLLKKDRLKIYLYLIYQIVKAQKQVLILVPNNLLIKAYKIFLSSIFNPKIIAVLDKEKSKGYLYKNWLKIKDNKKLIIIGTRSAVFSPFKSLKLILIDQAHDQNLKQWDQKPYYDARKIAQLLAEQFKAGLIYGTSSPNLNDYYRIKEKVS